MERAARARKVRPASETFRPVDSPSLPINDVGQASHLVYTLEYIPHYILWPIRRRAGPG